MMKKILSKHPRSLLRMFSRIQSLQGFQIGFTNMVTFGTYFRKITWIRWVLTMRERLLRFQMPISTMTICTPQVIGHWCHISYWTPSPYQRQCSVNHSWEIRLDLGVVGQSLATIGCEVKSLGIFRDGVVLNWMWKTYVYWKGTPKMINWNQCYNMV